MNFKFLLTVLVLGCFLITKNASATHVMGGDLTYKHLHDSTYELKFLVYRDCNNGQANIDANINYWVYYRKTKKVFNFGKKVNLSSKGVFKVKPEAPNCVVPSGVCIEAGEYIDTVTLGGDPDGYIVTWYRMERNHAIDNLSRCVLSSDNTSCNPNFARPCSSTRNRPFGLVWTAEIPSWKFGNSSPQFLTAPVPYFCKGITNYFNHVAFDPDGDSLYFENVVPLSPEECSSAFPTPNGTNDPPESYSTVYQNVTYQSGYSVTKPFGATSATINVNGSTGEIKANPSAAGNYVIAIKISEYRVDPVTRKATYLGSIRRDLQFIAGTCPSNTPPKLTSSTKTNYYVDPDSTLEFTFSGSDNQDTVSLKAVGNIFGKTGSIISKPYATFRDTSAYKTVSQTFKWTPSCDHITYTSPHVISIFLSDEGCNTLQRTFSIYVNAKPTLAPPKLTCVNSLFNGNVVLNWSKPTLKDAFKQYQIYRLDPDGTRSKIKTITDSTTTNYVDQSISDGNTKRYRYYMKTENSCNLEGLPSDSLQTVVLSYTEISDKEIKLSWNAFKPLGTQYFFVQKKFANAFVNIDTTTNQSIKLQDCDLSGTYRIFSSLTANMSSCSSTSNELAVTTTDKTGPNAPDLTHTTYQSWSRIRLELKKSTSTDAEKYEFLRADNGGTYKTVATITSAASSISYIDNLSNNGNNSFCYRVLSIDECGNKGDSSTVHCPVNLKARTGQLEAILEWDKYKGYDIDSVVVARYDTINKKWVKIGKVAGNVNQFKDSTNIVCNYLYNYRLSSHQKDGSLVTLSDSASTRPIDTIKPPEIDIITTGILTDSTAAVAFLRSADDDVNKHMVVAYAYSGNKLVSVDSTVTFDNSIDTITTTVVAKRADSFQYSFEVYAIDSCNENVSASAERHNAVQLTGQASNLSNILNWTPYSGYTVSQYIVQTYNGKDWKNIQSLFSNVFQYTHNNLPCNQQQRYRIITVGNPLKQQVSVSDEIRLTPYDSMPPASPVINYATVTNDTSISINWNHSSSSDAQNYLVFAYRNNGAPILLDTIHRDDSKTTHTYVHTGIDAKTNKYCYEIIAYDTCNNNLSQNNIAHCAMQLSGSPGNKQNSLAWTAYTGTTVSKYEVQQFANNNWTTISILSGTASSYNHTNLDCYEPYAYRIKMTETGSNPDVSLSDTLVLTPFDTIYPSPPTFRSISVIANDTIQLNWDHSISDDVDRYILYVNHPDSAAGSFTLVDTLPYVNSYKLQVNKADKAYHFRIESIDICKSKVSKTFESGSSMGIEYSQDGCQNTLIISWDANTVFPNGVNTYELYKSVDGSSYNLLASTSNTSYKDNKVNPWHTYKYQVRAIESNTTGFDALTTQLAGIPYQPAIPEIKSVSVTESNLTNGEILVEWESQEAKRYIASHKLYYQVLGSGNFTLLAGNIPVTDSAYLHKGLNTKSTNHRYFLVNIDSCGNTSDTFSIHKSIDMEFQIGQLSHELEWTQYEGFTVSNYFVQQFIGGNYMYLDTLPASADTLYKFPAPCNTLITYRIVAQSDRGYQAFSDTASGIAIDNQLPDAPTIRNATVKGTVYNQINFTGVDSPDVFAYAIMRSRDGNLYQNRGYVLYQGIKKNESFNDTTNTNSGPYCYVVVALDSCLNPSESDTFCTSYLTGISGHFSNSLKWKTFKGYELGSLELQSEQGNTWSTLQSLSLTDSTFFHNNIGCNEPVTYRLLAISKTGTDTTISNQLTLTPGDTTSPGKPNIQFASVDYQNKIDLKWDYDANSDIKTYNIYRSENGSPFSLLNDTTFSGVYYDLLVDGRNKVYQYYIEAIDSCDITHISPASDTVSTFKFNLRQDTCQAINFIKWQSIDYLGNGADQYIVQRQSSGNTLWDDLDTLGSNDSSYVDTTSKLNVKYCFRLKALDTNTGYASYTDTFCHIQNIFNKPFSPEMFTASITGSDDKKGKVELKWNSISKLQEKNIKGYIVYSSDTVNGIFNKIGETFSRNDTLFYDTTNTVDDLHFYRISALNGCDVRGDSSILHSPIQLSVGGLNFAAELSWTEYLGFEVDQYEVERSVNGSNYRKIGSLPKGKYQFIDNLVSCGDTLNYRIKVTSANNAKQISYSDIETTLGTDTLPPTPNNMVNLSTSNSGKDMLVSWSPSPDADVESYTIIGKLKNDNVWTTYGTNITGTSYTVSGISPKQSEVYEFKVAPKDSCGNQQREYSTPHNSIGLNAVGNNGFVKLEWTNYRGWRPDGFRIYRNGTLLKTHAAGISRPDSIYTLKDSISICDSTVFEYYVEAYNANGQVSISNYDTASTIDLAKPGFVYIKTANTLTSGEIYIEWTKYYGDENLSFLLEKKNKENEWELVEEIDKSATNFTYQPSANTRHCFRIVVKDPCGNLGKASNSACVVSLEGGDLARANSLKWSKYETWRDSVGEYVVYRSTDTLNWYPIIKLEKRIRTYVDTNLQNDIFTYCYRVEAIEKEGGFGEKSFSNIYCISQKPLVFIPNAFTPGASPLINDGFGPKGSFLPENYSMKIYSRWGQRIYQTNTGEEWDGKLSDGELAPVGSYLYVVTYQGPDGSIEQIEGSVRLLR